MIGAIVSHQVLSLRRQRILTAVFATLIGVTVLAGVLGWSSHQTIVGVYDEAVKLLATRGMGAPPNPFLLKPQLAMLSNMVIYITMIGALVALVIGHVTVADDEANGIGRLVFSRQVTRTHYATGKLAAAGVVLAAALAACGVLSVAALALVNRTLPSVTNVGRLVGFYAFSWMYLMLFVAVGMVTVLVARRRSLGLLSAIGMWLVVTFVVPQFTSGLRPAQSLNPIVDPVSTSQAFFRVTARARPYSITEQFKEASGRILATAPSETMWDTTRRILPIAMLLVIGVVGFIVLVKKHDFSQSGHRD
jgi:ABC-type transport system involved in multi-copper enzyme maturation permease subunit